MRLVPHDSQAPYLIVQLMALKRHRLRWESRKPRRQIRTQCCRVPRSLNKTPSPLESH